MKAAVIYYSLEGNTEFIAKMIAQEANAELIQLKTIKEYPKKGFMKFFKGGMSVLFHQKPELQNKSIHLEKFDALIIGSPIWAGTYAPAIHSFLSSYDIKNKTIYLYACHGGGGADKYYAKMKKRLQGNIVAGTIDFVEPLKGNQEEIKKRIADFSKDNF